MRKGQDRECRCCRWIREVYTPWYNAQVQTASGNNGPPPPLPDDGG